ncbi:MAG: OmpA family protein [Blautia sp.]|nr:OmpA family protein [Blautia sp.]
MAKRRKSSDSGFNIWRSYSDMMAGVLLLFVLIMCVTLFQAQKSYNDSIKERDEKIALQEEYTAELLAQQKVLEEKEGQLKTQDEQLRTQDEELSKQEILLAEMAKELEEKQAQLDEQAAQLTAQSARLTEQQNDLDEKTAQIASQQKKIDDIIGVKAEVVESLRQEFASNNVNVDIDSKTGALTLDANVMFEYDSAELTEEGMAALRQVLPTYCQVLLGDQYKQYLGEIIIDGYTDNEGDYAYNLGLSQQRSLAVADYLLEIEGEFLSASESVDLRDYLTVNGHSMSSPILDANGNIDKDASRRVEVKFRLKDEEMISELSEIMSTE